MERRAYSPDARDIPLPLSPTPSRPNSPPQPILGKRGAASIMDRASTPSDHSPQKSRVWHGFASNVRKGYEEIHSSDSEGEDASDINPGNLSALVVPIKRGAKRPYRATSGSAGYDLYLPADITLRPHTITTIPLGLQIQLPPHYYLQLKGRSSLEKKGINLRGGVVDSDFRGDIAVILSNTKAEVIRLSAGQKVCQGIILKYHEANFVPANKLQPTTRGDCGFGHSN
ncbi:MAG: dUTP diphosphatase [Gammaproteobacteria bacterium]|nr:dUTP diphosphatase [Gammaproteobacteria bacterium]